MFLSKEHNSFNLNELKRLEACYPGVKIDKTTNIKIISETKMIGIVGEYIDFPSGTRLMASQALGHNGNTGYAPDYETIYYDKNDSLKIIIASDGFWDMVLKDNEEEIAKATENLVQIDYTKKQEYIDKLCQEETERLLKQQEEKIKPPTLEQVLSKKIDSITQRPYTIREGQKGESVGKIQQMLEKLGYGITLRKYDENKKAIDNDFGKNTSDAVGLFQGDNNLTWTGIVDSETLKVMLIKLKEVENEKENIK
jgi:hypothetical protein